MVAAFWLILVVALVLNVIVFICIHPIMNFLQVPEEIYDIMKEYLWIVFCGIFASFLYNYFASLLRAVGNSMAPLMFLAVSAVLNIILDLCFVLGLKWGVAGAAAATVFSQYVAGIGIFLYSGIKLPYFHEIKKYIRPKKEMMKAIGQFSFLTCLQQSVMNLGILKIGRAHV